MIAVKRSPESVLGLQNGATAEEVRSAYLQMVKKFPPDIEPERFREIYDAYQLLSDPLRLAELIATPPNSPPDLVEVVEHARAKYGRISTLPLLALGNIDQQ